MHGYVLFEVAYRVLAAGVRLEQIATHFGRGIVGGPGQELGLRLVEVAGGGLVVETLPWSPPAAGPIAPGMHPPKSLEWYIEGRRKCDDGSECGAGNEDQQDGKMGAAHGHGGYFLGNSQDTC